ncbi:Indigoidine synthase A like protein-domain-containing protein [Syncephalis fuscata]|nr:Indigoidine synthase A like protein-domain-containing protein [Syncephalis fuscata]
MNYQRVFSSMAYGVARTSLAPRALLCSSHIAQRRLLARDAMQTILQPSAEVTAALKAGKPVVALESTIISHGMPYPQNLTTAQAVESIVREHGCVPATIAILDGKIRVGLTNDELNTLAKIGNKATKTSRRDIAYVVAKGVPAATTIASTMVIAHRAGIPVFVTGGIGGVHYGAEQTMDISADLTELGRTPVAVVCGGAKSILDLEKTLEYLETQGVTVATYGSDEFPAFFTPHSGFKSPMRLDTVKECASLLDVAHRLQLEGGQVIAVPIPEQYAADGQEIQKAIKQALAESVEQNIIGKDITPFLLDRVNQRTLGKSLEANIALIKNNAVIGSQIAREFALLRQNSQNQAHPKTFVTHNQPTESYSSSNNSSGSSSSINNHSAKRLMVVGGCAVDITCTVASDVGHHPLNRSSYPGQLQRTLGGVGCNIARVAHKCGIDTVLVSITSNDADGEWINEELTRINLSCSQIQRLSSDDPTTHTAVYNAIHEADGQLYVAVANMDIFNQLQPSHIVRAIQEVKPAFICFDGNLPVSCIRAISDICALTGIPTLFEPTSIPKSLRILQDPAILESGGIHYITPNHYELDALTQVLNNKDWFTKPISIDKYHTLLLESIPELWHTTALNALRLSRRIPTVMVKLGNHGVLCASNTLSSHESAPTLKYYPALKPDSIVNFCGALVAGLTVHGSSDNMDRLVNIAQHAAIATLASSCAVGETITPHLLKLV